MDYYLLMPADTEADAIQDANHLGCDNSFGVFWGGTGLNLLMKMVEESPEMLTQIRILNDQGKKLM